MQNVLAVRLWAESNQNGEKLGWAEVIGVIASEAKTC